MGKKRIVAKSGEVVDSSVEKKTGGKTSKKRTSSGILHIQSTFNNTRLVLTDKNGNALVWSSSGSLGFKGAKKGTPFAASKVAETVLEKAGSIGVKDVEIVVCGIGSGRESALRTFAGKGIEVTTIRDITPVPHNGPRPPRPRRV